MLHFDEINGSPIQDRDISQFSIKTPKEDYSYAKCIGYTDNTGFHPYNTVTKPEHYNKSGIECIQAIEASMSREEFLGYLKGSVFKYLWRYRYKNNPQQDLDKANWYSERLKQTYGKEQGRETQA